MLRNALGSAAALVLVAAATGCGSSDGDVPSTSGPERQAFIAAGDRICRAYNTRAAALQNEILAIRRRGGKGTPLTAYREQLDEAAALARTASTQLGGLEPPGGEAAKVRAIIDLVTRQAALVGQLAAAAARNDAAAYQQVNAQVVEVGVRERAAMLAFGFSECGRAR